MKYTRLARSRRGFGKWHSLWLGDDHLLSVESTGYSEEYNRFYLKEIQAVILCRTSWGAAMNLILGLLLAIPLVAAYGMSEGGLTPESWVALTFAAAFLPFLCWNLFLGPTCRCYLRTPVGTRDIPALDRVRSARKSLARLRPLIGQLQGEISRKEIAALSEAAMAARPPENRGNPASPVVPPAQESESSYRGGFHRGAFLALVVEGALSGLQMFANSKTMVYLSTVTGITFLLLVIAALIKQRSRSVPPLAGRIAWGGVGTWVTGTVIGYFFMMFLSIEEFHEGVTQNEMFDMYAAIDPASHPAFAYFLLVYALLAAVIGIAGLIVMERGRGAAGTRRS